MPRTSARGGPETRARIAEAAATLFLEHGFDAVTVARIAKAAGVSSVTVFTHFPRKEDLFLDRSAEAVELLRAVGREDDVVGAVRALLLRLADERHPLSGLDPRSDPFLRTVAGSPALLGRARELAGELQDVLAAETGDVLLAAFVVAGYATVFVETARRRLAGDAPDEVEPDHRARVERLVTALRDGVA
jgi:AcrR family transcriptional regulator